MTDVGMKLSLTNALYEVMDPETGISIVDLGLVYDVAYEEPSRTARVTMTFTTPACPAGGVMVDGVKRRLGEHERVDAVEVDVTFEPRWTPERISEDGRAQLGW